MVKWTQANTATDLVASYAPLIKGKVILTTGVTAGSIGATYVETVATAQPALLILAGRNASKLDEEAANIAAAAEAAGVSPVPTRNLVVDLLSLDSVRKAAAEVNAWDDVPVIDVLHNCAGIMAVPYKLSADGYESQFAANHLSHFLFTNLILDKILASKSPRIVNVSSNGHRLGPMRWDDLNFDGGKTYDRWMAYGQAKTANCLMALYLAEKLGDRGLQAYSLHPGAILSTSLGNHLDGDFSSLLALDRAMGYRYGFMSWDDFAKGCVNVQQGAATSVYASFDPDLLPHNGAYLDKSAVADPLVDVVKPWITSSVEAKHLWQVSEEIVGQKFPL